MSCSINKLKSYLLFTYKNVMLSDFMFSNFQFFNVYICIYIYIYIYIYVYIYVIILLLYYTIHIIVYNPSGIS